MPTPVALQKVSVAPDRYYSIIDGVKTEITKKEYNSPMKEGEIHSSGIAFDTSTGELSDGQHATQANGFHWVKIPDYKVIKIDPDMVVEEKATVAGLNKISLDSEAE